MLFCKKVFIVLLLCVSLPFFIGAGEAKKGKNYKMEDVDALYESIRATGAVYQIEERIVSFQNEGMNLVATLVLPKGVKRPPIALTFNGFGEDRFYIELPNTGGEYFYERVSRILAEQGIAALRVDYRGSGDSDGAYEMTSFSGQVSDALAAINYVCTDLRRVVGWRNLGLVGFSQGGLVSAIAASRDERVGSLALWSAVTAPPITYEYLITREGLEKGIALPDGGFDIFPIIIEGQHYGDIPLGKCFFQDLFTTNPVAQIHKYKGPLLYVAGAQDVIVWPQPQMAQQYLDNHEGFEKLVVLDTDHEFKTYMGVEEFDKTIYWTAAWFLYTLR